MKHYNFGSIEQYRNICKKIKMEAEYQGKDADGKDIYNPNAPKPTLTFTGTVKLHGTNAAVVYSKEHGLYAQSRERVLSIESDNAGFAFYVESNREYFEKKFAQIMTEDYDTVVIYGEWAGCFQYGTPILLSDGTKKTIGEIVNGQLDVEVLSYNQDTNTIEPKKIIAWHKNGRSEDWLKITYKRRFRGGRDTSLRVTPNHKIFTKINNELVEVCAGNLKEGDTVFLYGKTLPYHAREFLKGTILGDGSFCGKRNIKVGHSDKHNFYNNTISKLLGSEVVYAVSGYGSRIGVCQSQAYAAIEDIYNSVVTDGKITPSRGYLDTLSPLALAVWYMDDGSLEKHTKPGRQVKAVLHTNSFGKETVESMIEWFNARDYKCYLFKAREGQFGIKFTPDGTDNFLFTIAPYVLEGFNYKLPAYMHEIPKISWENNCMSEYNSMLVETTIAKIEKFIPEKEHEKTRYDITVEGNSNYFANKCLVHNSNIQKGVGICNVPKKFYPFLMKYFKGDELFLQEIPYGGHDGWCANSSLGIHPITQFDNFKMDIDFNHPEQVQDELIRITEEVERECPVAKAFGHSGIGEGVVWTADWNGKQYRFKVKGEKHSSSKVKTLASVNTDKIESCQKFAEYAVTESRFEQALQAVFPDGNLDVKQMGALLKWMNTDIVKEEMDTLVANNLEFKEVVKYVADATKKRFFERTF